MIDELFADTVVISHHEKLFTSPSKINNANYIPKIKILFTDNYLHTRGKS